MNSPRSQEPACGHPRTPWRTARTAVAVAVAAAAILFLSRALQASWRELAPMIDISFLVSVLLLSFAYGACLFILSGSWYLTLRRQAPGHGSAAQGVYVYLTANIAKYLPGNVFHFAGRQVLGARAGWGHGAIARATLLELGAVVTGILLLLFLSVAMAPADLLGGMLPQRWAATVTPHLRLVAFALLAVAALAFYAMARLHLSDRLFGVPASAVGRAVALCALFFGLYAGLVMLFAARLPVSQGGASLYSIGLAYLLAWLAGFVVPGAPGGLGVRESVLVLLLAGLSGGGSAGALSLGIGMRFVSTLGDAIAVAVAFALCRAGSGVSPQRRGRSEWI